MVFVRYGGGAMGGMGVLGLTGGGAGAGCGIPGRGADGRARSIERPATGWDALTDSELEVVHLVATGLTNAKTAEQLFVSPHTIGTHLRHIFTKLDVTSRTAAAGYAFEHHIT